MHLLLKEYCNDIQITAVFEKSVIRRAIAERTRQLKIAKHGNFLVGGSAPFPELSRLLQVEAMVGRHLTTTTGQQFHVDDVVFPSGDRSDCALIKACFSGEGVHGLVLESLQLVTNVLIGPDEPQLFGTPKSTKLEIHRQHEHPNYKTYKPPNYTNLNNKCVCFYLLHRTSLYRYLG